MRKEKIFDFFCPQKGNSFCVYYVTGDSHDHNRKEELKMKKLLKVIITFALMLCILSTGVLAAEESSDTVKGVSVSRTYADDGIMPLYLYIAYFRCTVDVVGNDVVCRALVDGYEGITTQIRIEMRLKKKGLFGYNDIVTWSDGFDAISADMVRSYPYESGAKYKLYVYIEVYHGSDFESDSFLSDPIPK